jgi:hypothetical protein
MKTRFSYLAWALFLGVVCPLGMIALHMHVVRPSAISYALCRAVAASPIGCQHYLLPRS